MRARIATATAAIGVLLGATAACGSSSSSSKPPTDDKTASGAITVWLQTDAQTLWPQAVTDAEAAFNKVYPDVKVTVSYQAWTDHLTKFDAAAQAHTAPDVIEFGNSETGQYVAAGALKDFRGGRLPGQHQGHQVHRPARRRVRRGTGPQLVGPGGEELGPGREGQDHQPAARGRRRRQEVGRRRGHHHRPERRHLT